VARPARPEDVYRFRIPTEPQLSPDGDRVVFTVKAASPRHDGYRTALWIAPADGDGDARPLTIGAKADRQPRFAPDGRTLAFLSDRRLLVEDEPDRPKDAKEREDATQIHLLPLDGGEARRLTDLPRSVDAFEWSPDGTRLAILTASVGATRKEDAQKRGKTLHRHPEDPPPSDYRYLDRLEYMLNGAGFIYDHVAHLWLVDATTGEARRLVAGPTAEAEIAWSPDGTRVAFTANRHRDHDLHGRSDVFVVDVESGRVSPITGGPDSIFIAPRWTPDGASIVAIGGRWPGANYHTHIWRFAADGSDARRDGGTDLLAGSDLMPASGMNSDATIGEGAHLAVTGDGRHVLFTAPIRGSYELWRVPVAGGEPQRLTDDRHFLSGWDAVPAGRGAGAMRIAAVHSGPTDLPEIVVTDVGTKGAGDLRRVTGLNAELRAEVDLVEPTERWWTVDGFEIQGWHYAGGTGKRPLVLEIHGGPHTLYGASPMWEWQVLAGAGISVLGTNPRGSEGYGGAFNRGNLDGDWGPGPMRDVIAGIDGLVADGLADPARLGVTGGSYGGYLTNWILGHDRRFAAGITCRSVADMSMLFLTGDIAGGQWAEIEFGGTPWSDPELFRKLSPVTYAREIRTPLLIQHAERDLRTTVGQGEALFTVLRSHRRPVRFMRVPDESHELTRSGTPFRRVENLVQVRDWFDHFLVKGAKTLPKLPADRAGK
jgi:dipeptidyl aminopeptidase/acylaminoacyl peptidase